MSPHPCADHPCDHCYWCDVVGICCQTISAEQRAQLQADERLRTAIAKEAGNVPSFQELVRLDALRRPGALLPPAPSPAGLLGPAATSMPEDSRKEAIHVLVSRTTR
jgi:hypothetical protein